MHHHKRHCWVPHKYSFYLNQHLGSASLKLIDITETSFETENDVFFNPKKLDLTCDKKRVMTNAFVKMLKKIAGISKSCIAKNATGLLSRKIC